MKKGLYTENGVCLSKKSPKVGDEVELIYTGLLKTSGANQVKVHIGYNETWEDSEYIDMNSVEGTFSTTIFMKKAGTLNCAFTDPVGNWDNNSGQDYVFKVADAKDKAKNKASEKQAKKPALKVVKNAEPKEKAKASKASSTKKVKEKDESAKGSSAEVVEMKAKTGRSSAKSAKTDEVKPKKAAKKAVKEA